MADGIASSRRISPAQLEQRSSDLPGLLRFRYSCLNHACLIKRGRHVITRKFAWQDGLSHANLRGKTGYHTHICVTRWVITRTFA